jgi:hypothetical protein
MLVEIFRWWNQCDAVIMICISRRYVAELLCLKIPGGIIKSSARLIWTAF